MPSDNTTPEPPPTPSSSSISEADSHTPFPSSKSANSSYSSQEPQAAMSSTATSDNQLEHGKPIETEATDGFQRGNLDTTPTQTPLLHIPTFGGLHSSQVLVQDGLEWVQETFNLRPAWSLEPSADAVADVGTKALRCQNLISTPSLLNKPFLEFQGAFNKLYPIISNNGSYLMRVSLPVDPTFKIWSEVSTIALLRTKTTIPVPNVIAHSSSRENEIGFEWMLIERVVDVYQLGKVWRSLPWTAKEKVIEDVASIMGQLFDVRADTIGSIYQLDTTSCEDKKASPFVVGRIVSMPFFWGDHVHLDHIPRGPFTSSRDWLHSRLQLLLHDCTVLLANPGSSEAEIEDSLRTQAMVHRLLKLLPAIFPAERESFALHHDDLSHQNILLNHTGALKVIVDWECTSTMPLFMCCQLPDFLQSRERTDKPKMERYRDPENEDSLYQEHLKDYELTLLRKTFIEFMQTKYPAWAEEHHAAGVRAEFESAVSGCDGAFTLGDVEDWLDRVEGEYLQILSGAKE